MRPAVAPGTRVAHPKRVDDVDDQVRHLLRLAYEQNP
jgi:hypothetical protein